MSEWETRKLKNLLYGMESVNPKENPTNSFTYVDVSSVSRETCEIVETSVIKGCDAPSRARRLIKTGDVLFATIRPTLKRIAIVPSELNHQVCSTGYFVLKPKEELNNRFLFHFLFTAQFQEEMERRQKGASYPAVNNTDVTTQEIPLPPLAEQKRIVAILDEAFGAIAKAKENAEKNLANAKELFDSYLNRVFTEKGDGWEEKRLDDVAITFGRGKSRHRPRNDKSLYGGKYPFIQTGEIRNANHYVTEFEKTYSEKGLAQSRLWPAGTLCITIAANIAETAILAFDACIPDSVIGLVPDPSKANVEFVEFLLQFFKSVLQAQGKGSAQDNINMGTFERNEFPFAPLDEQSRIVGLLNALVAETSRLGNIYEQKLASLDELKQSILQKAFTGQLTAKSPELEAVS